MNEHEKEIKKKQKRNKTYEKNFSQDWNQTLKFFHTNEY